MHDEESDTHLLEHRSSLCKSTPHGDGIASHMTLHFNKRIVTRFPISIPAKLRPLLEISDNIWKSLVQHFLEISTLTHFYFNSTSKEMLIWDLCNLYFSILVKCGSNRFLCINNVIFEPCNNGIACVNEILFTHNRVVAIWLAFELFEEDIS